MTRRPHTRGAALATACCALALAAAGCGSDEEGEGIPPSSVRALEGQLDSIQSRVDQDACADVTDGEDTNVSVVERRINELPSDVDPEIRDALERSFERLFQLVQEECRPTETETETETVPPETVPPQTTPTEPQTETEPPQTQTEEQPPPSDNDQGGGGGGGGGGNDQGGQPAPEGDE